MSGTLPKDHCGSTLMSQRGWARENAMIPRMTPRPYAATASTAKQIRRSVCNVLARPPDERTRRFFAAGVITFDALFTDGFLPSESTKGQSNTGHRLARVAAHR